MDIVTHALMGTVLAGPILGAHPLTGACFILGSVIPDLDALSRCFGKRTFLRWHQTYTHGLPFIFACGGIAWLLLRLADLGSEPCAPFALVAGMLLHVALDVTNTYGTAVLSPVLRRRFCVEWVFFIDAIVLAATLLAIALQLRPELLPAVSSMTVAVVYLTFLSVYWLTKAGLHARAFHAGPAGTVSLIPSALVPWRFFGCARSDDQLRLFRLNAVSGRVDEEQTVTIQDDEYLETLSALPEVRIMRELSPAYHVVHVAPVPQGTEVVCRDLRVRNFGGRFGELTAVLDRDGRLIDRRFNV